MKLLTAALISLLFSSCGGSGIKHEKKPFKVDSVATKDSHKTDVAPVLTGTIRENEQFKNCKYPALVIEILVAKRQRDMEEAKLPREYYSDWFYSLYDAAHSDPAITEFLDKAIANTITYMAKSVEFNYAGIAAQDTTVKIFMSK